MGKVVCWSPLDSWSPYFIHRSKDAHIGHTCPFSLTSELNFFIYRGGQINRDKIVRPIGYNRASDLNEKLKICGRHV